MNGTILFVHGTGVRASGYAATLRTIRRELAARGSNVPVHGCFWGEAAGAKLLAGGASIPGYNETGGDQPSAADQAVARWSLLYLDPWYELRLLRNRPTPGPTRLGQEPPASVLRRYIDSFVPPPAVVAAFAEAGLGPYLDGALGALRAAPELAEAISTAPAQPLEHRQAIARAVVAWSLVRSEDDGEPALHGGTRDRLERTLSSAIEGGGLGVAEFLLRPGKGIAKRLITRKLTGDRGSLSDAAAPTAGDVLRFLAHGDQARDYVLAQIRALRRSPHGPKDSIFLLAHSLGGIICADLLIRAKVDGVSGLITVGSQTPFLYEIGAFPPLTYPDQLPDHMPSWLNIYDRRDLLSYVANPIFGDRAQDVLVDNGQPFPQSHGAYWTNPALWTAVEGFMG